MMVVVLIESCAFTCIMELYNRKLWYILIIAAAAWMAQIPIIVKIFTSFHDSSLVSVSNSELTESVGNLTSRLGIPQMRIYKSTFTEKILLYF